MKESASAVSKAGSIDNSAVARYWDAVAARYLELFRNELDSKRYDCEVLRNFAASLGAGARVCDAGCGPCAHVAGLLAGEGLQVVGIDISPECVKLAREQEPALEFRVMDMMALDFAQGAFDGLLAYYALHYQPKSTLNTVLREFARVLRKGGRLLLVVKEGDGEGWVPDPLGVTGQVFWGAFQKQELETLVSRNGFQVLDCTVRDPLPEEILVRRIYLTARQAA